jgi:hypothetical protein
VTVGKGVDPFTSLAAVIPISGCSVLMGMGIELVASCEFAIQAASKTTSGDMKITSRFFMAYIPLLK